MDSENIQITPETTEKKEKKTSVVSELYDYLEMMILAACAVMLLFTFSIRLCRVDGNSMFSTLKDKQQLLVNDLFYTPENGDIIVFHQSDNKNASLNKPLVKRVIATENQWYKIVYYYVGQGKDEYLSMKVYVSDDEKIDEADLISEDYINFIEAYNFKDKAIPAYLNACTSDGETYTTSGRVPEGMLFVMGDNRYDSNDSRLGVGYVDERCVLGKVIFRVVPPGTVK